MTPQKVNSTLGEWIIKVLMSTKSHIDFLLDDTRFYK